MIDIEKLRDDLKMNCYGAFYEGGYGGALIQAFDLERASPQTLIRIAQDYGLDLEQYRIDK